MKMTARTGNSSGDFTLGAHLLGLTGADVPYKMATFVRTTCLKKAISVYRRAEAE